MKIILLFILSAFFVSCSTHVVVSPRGCVASKARMGDSSEVLYNEGHWMIDLGYEENVFLLKDLIESKDLECKSISSISYEVRQGPAEVMLSLLPFINRKRIIVKGIY